VNAFLRDLFVYGDAFWTFYHERQRKVQDKIDYVIGLVRSIPMVPEKFLKHLEGTDGLYEIRVQAGSDIYRIFCFFDEGRIIILLNGFQKKSNKTPGKEIARAKRLKDQYYANKKTS